MGSAVKEVGRGVVNAATFGTAELLASEQLDKVFGAGSGTSPIASTIGILSPSSSVTTAGTALDTALSEGPDSSGLVSPGVTTETKTGLGTPVEAGSKTFDIEEESKRKAISKKKLGAKALQIPLTAPVQVTSNMGLNI